MGSETLILQSQPSEMCLSSEGRIHDYGGKYTFVLRGLVEESRLVVQILVDFLDSS